MLFFNFKGIGDRAFDIELCESQDVRHMARSHADDTGEVLVTFARNPCRCWFEQMPWWPALAPAQSAQAMGR